MNNLNNSQTFCYLPFGSIYVAPSGELAPCCVAAPFNEKINFKDFNTIDEMINSEPYKRMRKQMLNNVAPSECSECFVYKNQHKDASNKMFKDFINESTLYNEDYSVNKVVYTDLRLSNHCNFKCRMCYHGSSSSWYEYWGYIQGIPDYQNNNPKYITVADGAMQKFSDANIDSIRKIYLAGGEPFITPTTFELLDKFTDAQASQIDISINTNLSTLTYKGIDILEKLSRFKHVWLAASCDGYGKIGEYQRPGFNSDKFFENLKKVVDFKKTHHNFLVDIDYTISTINMYHSFDFIDYVNANFLEANNIRFHNVTQPFFFAPASCTPKRKEDLIKFYEDNIANFKHTPNGNVLHALNEFVKYLKVSQDHTVYEHLMSKKQYLKISLPEMLKRFDEVHGTDYKEVCPWLAETFLIDKLI
jgi:radical SAM protein with 4Fe4S-binding SPASM domain